MAVKTITITDNAYTALKSLKNERESFSDTIMRIAGKKPLRSFIGILSKKSAEDIKDIIERRRRKNLGLHKIRIKETISAFERN